MGLRDLERRIQRGVDGVLGRVFRGGVNRLEIDKRLERELDSGTRKGEQGTRVMPNSVEVRLNPNDFESLEPSAPELERELLRLARSHARDQECGFVGPLVVRVTANEKVQRGAVDVQATAEHTIDGIPPGTLVFPDGFRFDLAQSAGDGTLLGRNDEAGIVVDDDKASRNHARIRPTDRGWIIEDLDSTNGTRVNGFRAAVQLLRDGDHVTIGATTFLFDAS